MLAAKKGIRAILLSQAVRRMQNDWGNPLDQGLFISLSGRALHAARLLERMMQERLNMKEK